MKHSVRPSTKTSRLKLVFVALILTSASIYIYETQFMKAPPIPRRAASEDELRSAAGQMRLKTNSVAKTDLELARLGKKLFF